MMNVSVSAAPISKSSSNVLYIEKNNDTKSEVPTSSRIDRSPDPRSTYNLTPQQSAAVLSIKSSNDSGEPHTSAKNQDVAAANRLYLVSAHDVTDEGGLNPGPSVTLPPISVGPGSGNPGDPSNGGGSPPGGNGGGSTPGVGGDGQGPTQVGTGGDSSLQFSASPISESDYANAFTSNPKQLEFGDINFGAVVLSGNSSGRNADGSIYTDGIIDFKTAKGTFQASASAPGTYITAKPVTNPDGTAGMEITVNRGA